MDDWYIDQETYDYIRKYTPIPTVDGIIIRDDKILLMKRLNEPAKGLYWSPGGRVRKFEPLEDALKRNVYEETGLTVKNYVLIDVIDQIWGFGHGVSSYYLVDVEGENIRLNEEHSEYKWFPLNDLPLIHPYLKKILNKVMEMIN